MSTVYNPGDIFIAKRNATSSSFVEYVLQSSPNSILTFDATKNLVAVSPTTITVGTSSYFSGSISNAISAQSASYAPTNAAYSSSVSIQIGLKQNTLTNTLYGITSSLALTASYFAETPPYKAGKITSTSFGGSPQTSSITFTTPFADDNYSVIINSGNARAWTVESLVSTGFVINSNSNQPIIENVYWTAMKSGESS
jgi:hypothetical protein